MNCTCIVCEVERAWTRLLAAQTVSAIQEAGKSANLDEKTRLRLYAVEGYLIDCIRGAVYVEGNTVAEDAATVIGRYQVAKRAIMAVCCTPHPRTVIDTLETIRQTCVSLSCGETTADATGLAQAFFAELAGQEAQRA